MSLEGLNGQDEPFKRINHSPVLLKTKGKAWLKLDY